MNTLHHELFIAIEYGDIATITRLLAAGADIDAVDEKGRTPAMFAVHTNQFELFRLFVRQGANIHIQDNYLDNPLLYAAALGRLSFVKAALAAGADTTITNRYGGTALIPAAERGHVEVVEELLASSDVDVNHINNLGWTALLEAINLGDGGKNHQAVVNLLIAYGADVNLPDKYGITPLGHAKRRGYYDMINALMSAGGK